MTAPVARLLQMLLTCGQRSRETARMKWAHIELPHGWESNARLAGVWWEIPGSETKAER